MAYMNKLTKEEQVRVVTCLVEGKLGVIAPVTFDRPRIGRLRLSTTLLYAAHRC